jgi:diguanylate cyclase (GGDEF)-like protein
MSTSKKPATQQLTCTSLLQSVANITELRDRDQLARSLVITLSELINSSRITMYRIIPSAQIEEVMLLAEACDIPEIATPASKTNIVINSRADFVTVLSTGKESIQLLDKLQCLSIYPIVTQHGVVGLMELISDIPGESEKNLILSLLKVYSNYLSILVESETDKLTGFLNRRTFDNSIEDIVSDKPFLEEVNIEPGTLIPVRRQEGTGFPHWLAMIDIDHFKIINDTFGHLYGDEVLLLLTRNMKRVFRQRDKLFRFGGEEFVVVLDRTSLQHARNVLERFRAEIENFQFPQVGKVTISIGFVCMDKADVSSSIIGRADQALYYAKQHGRNQVCFYEDLVADGKLAGERYSDDMQLF